MPDARLEVTDALGRRIVPIGKESFGIGRRETNDLRLAGSEVSRDHAEIVAAGAGYLVRDKQSRYGTYVNDEPVTERTLVHGDRIRLGRTGGAELVFLLADTAPAQDKATTTAIGDLRQIAALLDGLRALGSGRVLDDVLALVLDSAIEVTGAERGFIMMATASNELEFKLARGRRQQPLSGTSFATSRKIPEEVFRTGEPKILADLLDGELANVHMGTVALGIRNVQCVPLKLVRYVDRQDDAVAGERRIGVLYLDSREKGTFLSGSTRGALETLATEAAVAIENARLYRETMEKAKMEQEMRIAAEIQQALLPKAGHSGAFFRTAASSLPCRSIGGDFYDYVDLPSGAFGFALGDVAGKGPPAALLSAMMQGIFAAQAAASDTPSQTIARVNLALYKRGIESRFVTLMYGTLEPDGRLTYCNAGHNPPLIIGAGGIRRLEVGGPIVGLFEGAEFQEETVTLSPGDLLLVFSDGVSEALSAAGDEYGESRIIATANAHPGATPGDLLQALFSDVRAFTKGAAQSDDITALVLRYGPMNGGR
jgi:serine phosphatase RsbU (regulator of sigma subunit)/pSer/pThr/pTyr-binding forkhead associated (FHA) protein